MTAADYLERLEKCAVRDKLPPSELRPCSSADIMSVEHEVGMTLPSEYVDFLCQVGTGKEFGGLAIWFHLDLTRPGNVLECSQRLMHDQTQTMSEAGIDAEHYPEGLLIFYDPCDGGMYGFLPASDSVYHPHVYFWDCETHELEQVADNLYIFLALLCEDYS
jgi:hypothetical protein